MNGLVTGHSFKLTRHQTAYYDYKRALLCQVEIRNHPLFFSLTLMKDKWLSLFSLNICHVICFFHRLGYVNRM